ncbi:MAG: hypothetical protein Q4A78_09500 [Peptostreptococcaceae bacterium]|nr:hypothetical protein [Peptostreptococcaceae bacterium]
MARRSVSFIYWRGRIGTILSGFFIFAFGGAGIDALFDPEKEISTIVILFLMMLFAIWRFVRGMQRVKAAKLYPDYCHALEMSRENKLSELVLSMGKSEQEIVKDLQRIRKEKLFASLVISADGVINIMDPEDEQALGRIRRREEKMQKLVSVRCFGCGASAQIDRESGGACEYCGTYLRAQK